MTMSAKPSMIMSPWMTVAARRGVHSSASWAQLALTTLGTTTRRGKASAASAASSACAVLPGAGSSASRNVRWPFAAAATTWAWWCMSSSPRMPWTTSAGSGKGMQVASPPYSNAKQGGQQLPVTQPVGRRTGDGTAEKSGARKGSPAGGR